MKNCSSNVNRWSCLKKKPCVSIRRCVRPVENMIYESLAKRGDDKEGSCFVWPHRGKRNAGNAFPAITIIHERLHYPFAARRLLFFIYGQAHYFCASKHMKNFLSPPCCHPLVTRFLRLFWFLLLRSILVRTSYSHRFSPQTLVQPTSPRFLLN